jgi:urease accessory protein
MNFPAPPPPHPGPLPQGDREKTNPLPLSEGVGGGVCPQTTNAPALLRLLAWLSPAFPTGGYAWSHGVEWAVENDEIRDGETLRAWVADILRHGSGHNDLLLVRHAHRAAHDIDALTILVELALAAQPSRERRAETIGQGNAFLAAAAPWQPTILRALAEKAGDIPYPVAVGALAGAQHIAEDDAALGILQAFAANLISAAVRLVPLGQSTGLAVLAALEPDILAVAGETAEKTLDDLGSACFRSDIASMRHETQYTRLFRS